MKNLTKSNLKVQSTIIFYDEEYDSAVKYYSVAIQAKRLEIANNHEKILYSRNRLLVGLYLGRSNRYENPLARDFSY